MSVLRPTLYKRYLFFYSICTVSQHGKISHNYVCVLSFVQGNSNGL